MNFQIADLCDHHLNEIKIAAPIFQNFGGRTTFGGQIHTIKVYEDNVLIKEALSHPGQGKVLVVDGGGSLRCALAGHQMIQLAIDNNWEGLIIYGCLRNSAIIAQKKIGLKALNTHPLRSMKRGRGDNNLPISFAGVTFFPEHYVYADADGIIVTPKPLINGK